MYLLIIALSPSFSPPLCYFEWQNSWNDPLQLNAGWLSGLVDLNTEKENVQDRIADYAAKHIQPDDLVIILTKVRNNLGGRMPADW